MRREVKPAISVNRKFWVFTNTDASAYDREVIQKAITELRKSVTTCETFITDEMHHMYEPLGVLLERFGHVGSNVTKNQEEDSLTIKLRFCTDEMSSTIVERILAPLGFTKSRE